MVNGDAISRKQAINQIEKIGAEPDYYHTGEDWKTGLCLAEEVLYELGPVKSVHNITMKEVLEYIDNMPEDVWQEFTSCLECRGWNLERKQPVDRRNSNETSK